MTPPRRRHAPPLLTLAAVVLTGAAYLAGDRYSDTSLRDPAALVTFLVMLGAFLAVLFLGS